MTKTFQPSDLFKLYLANRKILEGTADSIKGVGKSRSVSLARKGLRTVEDVLFFLPRAYEDRSTIVPIGNLEPGTRVVIQGEIVSLGMVRYPASGKTVFEMGIKDDTGLAFAKWFRFSRMQMEQTYRKGQQVIISGEVNLFRQKMEFIHPEVEIWNEDKETSVNFKRIVPVYSEVDGLSQKQVRTILNAAIIEYGASIKNFLPEDILHRRGLLPLGEALAKIHFPAALSDAEGPGISTCFASLIFEEFFFLEMGLALRRGENHKQSGIAFNTRNELFQSFMSQLPFRLTGAQKRTLSQIQTDMGLSRPMYRMVQGDVGSGKTVIAFAAAFMAIGSGFQAAIMAPTEILAEQHYNNVRAMMSRSTVPVYLLTGSLGSSARAEICGKLAQGEPSLLVGTHAIIQQGVKFGRLGLIVVDEQHRFGVLQRLALKEKGLRPDMLVMTATPIPRTLSMALYGDLDLSLVNELPRGRRPVKTKVLDESSREKIYEFIRGELARGGQAYIIYPLIEESENLDLLDARTMAERLQREVFVEYKVGLLHGRMRMAEKASVLGEFKNGNLQVLVATTVVEVGIDVPNATIMVIEHAERFGLSQLHQLRGRIGRGQKESWCLLLARAGHGSTARMRLKVLEKSADGFHIAEEDLRLRGPGEFLGTRQSGLPELRTADFVRDTVIMSDAKGEVLKLIEADPDFSSPISSVVKQIAEYRWGEKFGLIASG